MNEHWADEPEAVSYTHLDVYKRQGYELIGMLRTECVVLYTTVSMLFA